MNRDPIEALTETWGPRIRQAFLDAVQRIADRVSVAVIEARLRAGDVEGAVRALGLDPSDFIGLRDTIAAAYASGGGAVAETIPAARDAGGALLRIVFDVRNMRAEAWIAGKSATLIRQITDDQRATVRANLLAGLQAGVNPRTTALDLVGRVDKATGKRGGGSIGLTSGQEAWQRAYAAELAGNDPAALRNALTRGLRDKRFDRAVQKAIATGEPIPAATRAKMVTAYRNRSLEYRADTIARTETVRALGAAQIEAYEQAIDAGQVEESRLMKFPVSAHDERVRFSHREVEALNAKGVGWREFYAVPAGMAPQMHAPYDEPMCRCREMVRIDRFRGLE